MLRAFVVLLSLACFVGCSTTQLVTRPQAPAAAPELSPGMRVVVELNTGERHSVTVVELTEQALVTQLYKFKWSDIKQIEYERYDVGKSVLGLGALAIVAAIVVPLAIVAWVEHKEDKDD